MAKGQKNKTVAFQEYRKALEKPFDTSIQNLRKAVEKFYGIHVPASTEIALRTIEKEADFSETGFDQRVSAIFLQSIEAKDYKCQILDIKQNIVVAQVLLDEAKGSTKVQSFDREQLTDMFTLEEGRVFNVEEILMSYSDGSIKKTISYSKGTAADKAVFDKLDTIDDPTHGNFFKPAPDTATEDNF